MKCTIPPKIRQIQPVVSEEFANTHTYIHTYKHTEGLRLL